MKAPKEAKAVTELRRKVNALRSRLATCSIHDFPKVERAYNLARMELEHYDKASAFFSNEA